MDVMSLLFSSGLAASLSVMNHLMLLLLSVSFKMCPSQTLLLSCLVFLFNVVFFGGSTILSADNGIKNFKSGSQYWTLLNVLNDMTTVKKDRNEEM